MHTTYLPKSHLLSSFYDQTSLDKKHKIRLNRMSQRSSQQCKCFSYYIKIDLQSHKDRVSNEDDPDKHHVRQKGSSFTIESHKDRVSNVENSDDLSSIVDTKRQKIKAKRQDNIHTTYLLTYHLLSSLYDRKSLDKKQVPLQSKVIKIALAM